MLLLLTQHFWMQKNENEKYKCKKVLNGKNGEICIASGFIPFSYSLRLQEQWKLSLHSIQHTLCSNVTNLKTNLCLRGLQIKSTFMHLLFCTRFFFFCLLLTISVYDHQCIHRNNKELWFFTFFFFLIRSLI